MISWWVLVLTWGALVIELGAFGDNPYYFEHWCGGGLEYLDDKDCQKKFPSSFDRDWRCPIIYSKDQINDSWDLEKPLYLVDVNVSLPIPDISLSVILIRRTPTNTYYKYYSNGNHNQPFETWSSSKIFATANAASTLEQQCQTQGLYSTTTGKNGKTSLGDLISIICSYDTTKGYSSNSLARYMHDVGGREKADWLIESWLNRTNESFGGNYGEPTPPDLGFLFTNPNTSECQVGPNTEGFYDNSLSALTMSEFVRRLVLHEDIQKDYQLPGFTNEDKKSLLYGAEQSLFFTDMQWGGMTADTAIFIQSGVDMNVVDSRSNGKWRIFSKLGAGYSNSRSVGEIVVNSYSCFPVLSSSGDPVMNQGVEFVLTARSSVPNDSTLEKAEALLQPNIAQIVKQIFNANLN